MERELSAFATRNNTDKWAIVVDGQYGLFATKDEAVKVYNLVGGADGSDGLADTPFGSCNILPPNSRPNWLPQFQAEMEAEELDITDYTPIDITSYIIDHWATWGVSLYRPEVIA